MRTRLIALLGAAILTITAIVPAAAITNDYVEDFEHPFVGLIAFYTIEGVEDDAANRPDDDPDDEFQGRCSGSLIDDGTPADGSRVFLTAGHCPDIGDLEVADYAFIWFRQDAGTRFNGDTVLQDPLTGYPDACIDDPAVALDACVKSHELYNYGFDNFAGFPNTHDAAIAITDSAVVLPEYGTLAPVGTLDSLATARGTKDTTFLASGYGLSYSSPVGVLSFRERLMGYGKLTNLRSINNAGFNVQTNGNGKGGGSTCSGDSGGPIFYPADTNQIVAVTSFGLNSWCRGVDFSYRVDTQAVQDWIEEVAGDYLD